MFLDIAIIIFLIGLALSLLLVEIFLLPGITLAGIGGLLFAICGVAYAYAVSLPVGHITLAASVALFTAAFFFLLRAKSFNRVALNTDVAARLTSTRDMDIHPGDTGTTLSRLAPVGKAKINGLTVEAKSLGEFIDEDTPVTVLRVDGYNVIVSPN
jgi:membrane-bound ClpP family serine protease